MKKPIIPIIIFFLSATLFSCRKEIKSDKGGIDIISNVYFDASKGLDKMKTFHVSKLNYSHDTIIEIVPDLDFPELNSTAFFIKDSLFYDLGINYKGVIFSEMKKREKPKSVFNKKTGAIFSNEMIPNYLNRKNLTDTVLFKKNYKRFEVNSPDSYSRYYVYQTDTILPYSIYKEASKDYKGRIERIDSYNKKTDIFVSLQLFPHEKWDNEAKEIFNFNKYANKKTNR